MENHVIALTEQIKARHPETGKPVTVVGVDTSSYTPRLVVIHRGPNGIHAEIVEYADEAKPSAA